MRVLRSEVPTLADRWSPTGNAFGAFRLALALGVLVAHCWPIGFAGRSPGDTWTSGQTDLGSVSLFGLLMTAGFLNTDSALRYSTGRYSWRRFLRIFPGLWTCLIVTALVIAPLVALYENGSFAGFWTHPEGPFSYVRTNWFASMEQFPISGLLSTTPYGHIVGGPSAFDGSLWTLRYEFGCYIVLGVCLAIGVLRKAPFVVLGIAVVGWLFIVRDAVTASDWTIRPTERGAIGPFPLIGAFEANWVLYLGFAFMIAASARLYMHRIPMHGAIAAAAGAAVVLTMWRGLWFAIGLPAYCYVLLYSIVALRGGFQRFGRTRDYSYGVYIYAFPVQQVVALVGGAEYGVAVYILLCVAGTLALAIPSWHLIEHPAIGLKDRIPAARTRRRQAAIGPIDRPILTEPGVGPEINLLD